MSNPHSLTALHRAVIENDVKKVAALGNKYKECCDSLGFTPLELARFLRRLECLEVLQGFRVEQTERFTVQLKGALEGSVIGFHELQALFHVQYTPFLFFRSYEDLQEAVRQCPYVMRVRQIAKDYAYFRSQIEQGMTARVSVRWIDDTMGYGLFAEEEIAQGAFLGEYAGEVRRFERKVQDSNPYCMHYPTKWWSWNYHIIDSCVFGNIFRFANHSDQPNMQLACALDRGLLHCVFVAKQVIAKGMQLTFNYGPNYFGIKHNI